MPSFGGPYDSPFEASLADICDKAVTHQRHRFRLGIDSSRQRYIVKCDSPPLKHCTNKHSFKRCIQAP
ncbi:hypothetical protein ScPMuIL_011268 [Solemya velum]